MPRETRRLWVWPLLVVLVWLVVGGPLGSFAGRLAEVQENDNSAFLPPAPSRPRHSTRWWPSRTRRPSPTTRRLRARRRPDARRPAGDRGLPRRAGPGRAGRRGRRWGSRSCRRTARPRRSWSRSPDRDGEEVTAAIEDMRDVVADPPDGLTALVGGQGGVLGDFIVAFGAIDGVLLLVALSVVLVILVVVYRTPILPFVVLISAVLALGLASAAIYGMAARRPAHPQRPVAGDPLHPRRGRRDRLLAAGRRPVPRGAARPRVEVRRDAGRLQGRLRADRSPRAPP